MNFKDFKTFEIELVEDAKIDLKFEAPGFGDPAG